MTEQENNKQVPGKIGKVTFKAKNIAVFPQKQIRDTVKQQILAKVLDGLNNAPDDMDGYVIVGWSKGEGDFYEFDAGSIPFDYFPEFIKTKIERAIFMHLTGLEFAPAEEGDDDGDTET